MMTMKPPRAGMNRTSLALATAVFAASALLAGCAGSSAPTAYFTLQPVAPTVAVPYAGPPVQVLAVHLPAALDRVELLRETAPGRFEVDDFARWAGPPGRIARQALTEDLVNRLPPGAVVFPDAVKPINALGVTVDILSLRSSGGSTQSDISWTWRPTDPATLARGPAASLRTVRLSTPAGDGSPAATAQALGALLGQVADRIAADLAAMPPMPAAVPVR